MTANPSPPKTTSVVTTIESVAVQFRLYNKLGSGGRKGDYKEQPDKSPQNQLSEPFWLYLFLDDLSTIQLTHEIYVSPQGDYSYFNDLFAKQPPPVSRPGVDTKRCALLAMAQSARDRSILCPYYALLSPFRMPKSRLEYIVPNGKIEAGQTDKRKQFYSWAKDRGLEMLTFSPAEKKNGARRELWSPWLKGAALADEHYAAMQVYAAEHLDNIDVIQVAGLVSGLARGIPIHEYVSTANLEACKHYFPKLNQVCANTSEDVAADVVAAPFREMVLDMWQDKNELAHLILTPYLAHCYRAIRAERLHDIEVIDERFFDHRYGVVKDLRLFRRFLKAAVELNGTFAKALALARKGSPSRAVAKLCDWAEWLSRTFLRTELARDISSGLITRESVDRLQTMRGWAAPPAMALANVLESINLVLSMSSFARNPSTRSTAGLIGAMSSYTSSVLKVVQSVTPDPKELTRIETELGRGGQILESERKLLWDWTGRKRALKVGGAARSKLALGALGAISGLADVITGGIDAWEAMKVGDYDAAVGYCFFALGGLVLIGSALTGGPLGIAAIGQTLELVGFLTALGSESSDLGIWLRFCQFGQLNGERSNDRMRWWTEPKTLGQMAGSPRLQLQAFSKIVYQMKIDARIIVYNRGGVEDPKLDITVHFPYGYPKEAQLYLRITVLREDGHLGVPQPLAPWPDARRGDPGSRPALSSVSRLYEPGEVLLGGVFMFVHAWLDVSGKMDLYPEEKPVTETFNIRGLREVRE
jgi:hypothetical protein